MLLSDKFSITAFKTLCIIITIRIATIPEIPFFSSSPNNSIINPQKLAIFNFPWIPDSKTSFKSKSGKVSFVYSFELFKNAEIPNVSFWEDIISLVPFEIGVKKIIIIKAIPKALAIHLR